MLTSWRRSCPPSSRSDVLVLVSGLGSFAIGCQQDAGSPVATGGGDAASVGVGGQGGASSTSVSSGAGGDTSCDGALSTIEQVHSGSVAVGEWVQLEGVVAMSHKYLVSQGASSGSCLWGVFISSPGLSETQPGSGILVTDYGFSASIPANGTIAYCPHFGVDATGDLKARICDDIQNRTKKTVAQHPPRTSQADA